MKMCLECRACEEVCPSGVKYGELMELTRGQLRQQLPAAPWARWIEAVLLNQVFPNPERLRLATNMLRAYQQFGMQSLVRSTGMLRVLPGNMNELEKMLPTLGAPFVVPAVIPALGPRRMRVGLLAGCVMSTFLGFINHATVRVLTANGCEVVTPPDQGCCGAVHWHLGDRDGGRTMFKRNITAFLEAGVDYVIVNAAGCSAMMKDYGHILSRDPEYASRAKELSDKVRDVTEFLADLPSPGSIGAIAKRVTYQDPCHLAHVQRIRNQPRSLIKSIPGLEFVEMKEADRCCGSAGVYNITHYDLSMQILDHKMQDAAATNAQIIATANAGCYMQLKYGVQRSGMQAEVKHVVELLDDAYELAGIYQALAVK
jgi:glycolate oxidase iron-sulfur subunit